jgi:hypothetical protein
MKLSFRQNWHWRPLIALAALLVVLLAQPANSQQWAGPNPNTLWSNVNNWSPVGLPAANGNVFLTSFTGDNTATLNTVTPLLGSVIINANPGTFTVNQSSWTSALYTTAETIGLDGTGVYNQSAGTHKVEGIGPLAPGTIAQTLVLGYSSTGNGTYNKSGGNFSTYDLIVGLDGTGKFNQSSGNVTVKNDEFIGKGGTGVGTYNMSSGTQSIGRDLYLGDAAGANGTFTMSSGTLTVGRDEVIGNSGTGKFTQSSGSHTVKGEFDVGNNGGDGTFIMSSGSLNITGDANIGSQSGTGKFNQSSGSVTIGQDLILARLGNSSGTYSMSSGSLLVKGFETIGQDGTAIFNQTSGSNTVAKLITIGTPGGGLGTGTYNLTSGSLTSNNSLLFNGTEDILINSKGDFNVYGTATVTGDVLNKGEVKTTNADVTWNGNFTNNKSYISDPSTQTFNNNLRVNANGFIQADDNQDLFVIKGDFINLSTQNTDWDTDNARLRFATGGVGNNNIHRFDIAGTDTLAHASTGDNYDWRLLNITNQRINLNDPNAGGGALYLEVLTGAVISGNTITNIYRDPTYKINIYYDDSLAANLYLGGLTYNLNGTGSGQLIPY